MAKQVINIGTTANDGTGDPIRDAFDKVNDNFTELYTDDAGDVGCIVAGTGISVNAATGDVTVTNSSPNATHTGDVTGSGALTIATDAVVTAKILNDNVTHDKLEGRYTAVSSVSNRSGATSIDWSAAAIFVMADSLNGAIEFDFTNFKAGQVIDIYNLTGAQTITLDSDAGTSEAFFKVGGIDYAGGSTNLLQVTCLDDSANAKFAYVVQAYVSDTTP